MARLILSEPGDTLDLLCWRALGSTDAVASVYAANPGLAAAGPILPTGTPVTVPETATAVAPLRETIQLWS